MSKDQVMPEGAWEFDASVTQVFNDMLERSIPQYAVMRKLTTDLALAVAPRGKPAGASVVDLGCSRGEALRAVRDGLGAHGRYWGVEVSKPMLEAARDAFADDATVEIVDADLRDGWPVSVPPADVTLCVLTLQFTPIERRQRLLAEIRRETKRGGALLLVEKVLGADAEIDEILVGQYYALKAENGYSAEQIERKRLSLEGVLVPVTAAWNEELLRQAGFRHVDCYWRWSNFAAWIAIA